MDFTKTVIPLALSDMVLLKLSVYSTRIFSPEVVAGSVVTALAWVAVSLVSLGEVIGCLYTADELNSGKEIIIDDSKINIFTEKTEQLIVCQRVILTTVILILMEA